MKPKAISAALATALVVAPAYNGSATAQSTHSQQAQQPERIHGYRMMSDAERNEYREKMRNANTAKERQALRDEHRAAMDTRMKEHRMEPGQMRGKGAGLEGPLPRGNAAPQG